MNCCLQKYIIHQSTYFLYYLLQDKFKNPRMMKIQEVHQKIHAKQFLGVFLDSCIRNRIFAGASEFSGFH